MSVICIYKISLNQGASQKGSSENNRFKDFFFFNLLQKEITSALHISFTLELLEITGRLLVTASWPTRSRCQLLPRARKRVCKNRTRILQKLHTRRYQHRADSDSRQYSLQPHRFCNATDCSHSLHPQGNTGLYAAELYSYTCRVITCWHQ